MTISNDIAYGKHGTAVALFPPCYGSIGTRPRFLREYDFRRSIEKIAAVLTLVTVVTVAALAQQGQAKAPLLDIPAGVTVERDLVYAQYGTRQLKLDLYHPSSGVGPFIGIVFIHGGGWEIGNKDGMGKRAADMAAKGFVTVSIDYRLSDEAPFPAALYDCKAAVRWMHANATKYQIDPNKIAASGGSAGGHLAALLGTTGDVKTLEGDGGNGGFSSRVGAVVASSGVYDVAGFLATVQSSRLQQTKKIVLLFMGGPLDKVPEVYMEASPVAHVCRSSPPFLLFHATEDPAVPYQQAVEMQKALQAVGVRVDLFTAQSTAHGVFDLQHTQEFLRSVFGN